MSLLEMMLLAIGLSMDSFAAAISAGMHVKRHIWRNALRIGICFALFQAAMPLLGWAAGVQFHAAIQGMDHIVACGLLGFIGIKTIVGAFQLKEEEIPACRTPLCRLCCLGIATSIDALAVGVSFAFIDMRILPAILIIGCSTFLLSFAGAFFGRRVGLLFEEIMEVLGGLVLIGIGLKILIEHLVTKT